MTTNADERSLKDLLLESADDLEQILKITIDTLINREKSTILKTGETVENLIRLYDGKQEDLRVLLKKVPEFQEREKLIRALQAIVEKRDATIHDVENNLKACEVGLTRSCHSANVKLKQMKEAELRPVNSEMLIKLAHQISKHNSVSAPLTWQMGDPSRPFPQEHEFRAGHLLNPKTQSQTIPGRSAAQKPLNGEEDPPLSPSNANAESNQVRTLGPALVHSRPEAEYSPRTGYGKEKTPPLQVQVQKGATANEKQWQNQGNSSSGGSAGSAGPSSQAANTRIPQSPSSSPRVKVTGIPTQSQVQQVADIAQMSSDSDNSSQSSDDEGPAVKKVPSNSQKS